MSKPDVSIILTAHREGVIAGVTARSAQAAMRHAEAAGLTHETIVVLDRADALTGATLREALQDGARYLETDEGDPGLARNRGIACAEGLCATFLDGDDLWSENWLTESWKLLADRPNAVGHSACNLVFGMRRCLWWHVDSDSPLCDRDYLSWMNYWDAMTFARTDLYRRYPFKANDLTRGFGHEDWHWNAWTLADGIRHMPVPTTLHFKRARPGSQMHRVDSIGGVRWPLNLPDAAP